MSATLLLLRKAWQTFACLFASLTFTLADDPPVHLWPTLTLTTGAQYHDARLTKIEPSAIKIMHANGVARIPLEFLPEKVRQLFPYDEQKAAEHRLQLDAEEREALRLMAEEKAAIMAKEAEAARRMAKALLLASTIPAAPMAPPVNAAPPAPPAVPITVAPAPVETIIVTSDPVPVYLPPAVVPCPLPPPPAPEPVTISVGGMTRGPGAMFGR